MRKNIVHMQSTTSPPNVDKAIVEVLIAIAIEKIYCDNSLIAASLQINKLYISLASEFYIIQTNVSKCNVNIYIRIINDAIKYYYLYYY